jgi:hypothetical protein
MNLKAIPQTRRTGATSPSDFGIPKAPIGFIEITVTFLSTSN